MPSEKQEQLAAVFDAMDALAWRWLEYREDQTGKAQEVVEMVEKIIEPAGSAFPSETAREVRSARQAHVQADRAAEEANAEAEAAAEEVRRITGQGEATEEQQQRLPEKLPERMTAAEAGKHLGISPSSLTHWGKEGLFPIERDGYNVWLHVSLVRRLAALQAAAPSHYKNRAKYVAKTLRQEKYGDSRMRKVYESEDQPDYRRDPPPTP